MTVLITGGAGYIGSHMAQYLLDKNVPVIVLDNLSTGHRDSLAKRIPFYQIDLCQLSELDDCFSKLPPLEAVIHFAGLSIVSESFKKPRDYYANNVEGSLNLLKTMQKYGVDNIVFSSTAAVYGLPHSIPLTEQHPTIPINPYGQTKLEVEKLLQHYSETQGFNAVCLRYFNAAGADVKNGLGENHQPETHLIPIMLEGLHQQTELNIYGMDYNTPDGTCIRDYIHVLDLCSAHLLSLTKLQTKPGFKIYNLGNGKGNSILEVIKVAEKITGKKALYKKSARREGDPPILIADPRLAQIELGWQPKLSLERIIEDGWLWHSNKLASLQQ